MTPGSRHNSKATRERLLRAGLELFTANGFLGTTTPALAERAGIAEGTIYRHFPSKEALLNEVYRETQRWLLGLLREIEGEKPMRVPERLGQLGRRLVVAAGEDPARVRMALLPRDQRFLDAASRDATREFRDGLQHLVAMGKSDGLVRAGPAELWSTVWLALVVLAAERVTSGEWTAEQAQVAQILEAAWEAIAARSTSAPSHGPPPASI